MLTTLAHVLGYILLSMISYFVFVILVSLGFMWFFDDEDMGKMGAIVASILYGVGLTIFLLTR